MNNEDWIIEIGDEINQKKADHGMAKLSNWEKLVYCLWVADFGMRNTGGLDVAQDVYTNFKCEGAKIAQILGLKLTLDFFSLDERDLGKKYFELFAVICDEIRNAENIA